MSRHSDLLDRAKGLARQLKREIVVDERTSVTQLGKLVEEMELELQILEEERVNREQKIAEEAATRKLEALNANRNDYRGRMRYPYEVAIRKTLQCRFGLLQEGAEVRPEFVGGQAELDKLVRSGAVLKRAEGRTRGPAKRRSG